MLAKIFLFTFFPYDYYLIEKDCRFATKLFVADKQEAKQP